jgi:hypothetical protein
VEREATRTAQIIIPASTVKKYLKMTASIKKGASLIEKAIMALDAEGNPVMSDTIMALCRLRRDGGVNIRYVQMVLKEMKYEVKATGMGHGVYGKGELPKTALAWVTPFDDDAQELPAVLSMTDAGMLECFAL